MKKILFTFGFIILTISLFGQYQFIECYSIEQNVKSNTIINNQRAYGDIIWSEDFGGGSIPSGWATVDNNNMGYVWYWSDDVRPGIQGTYSANNDTFFSATASNGYIMISGDIYNVGGGNTVMNSYFITEPINCDTASSVLLIFEQYFRNCCNSSNTSLNVSVSTDNLTWTDYSVINGVAINHASNNPDIVKLNISDIAAGQSTVYLKFHKSGASHYFWAIDDIILTNVPDNDIKVNSSLIGNVGLTSTGYEFLGYYSSIPTNQITPIVFMADIINSGTNTQHNIVFNTIVSDTFSTEYYNESWIEELILPNDTFFSEIPTYFNGIISGFYNIHRTFSQDETDEIPDNSILPVINFSINSNKVYARDYFIDAIVNIDNYVDGADGDFLGVNYYIFAPDTIESISVFISNTSDEGTIVIAKLYEPDGTSIVEKSSSEEYVIQLADLGQWVTIPFLNVNPSYNALEKQITYTVGVECYWGSYNLSLGADSNGPHTYPYASSLRIGSDWYWINTLPAIRMNLSGADVLPLITSIPETEVNYADSFEYIVTTTDPQGLPVTIEATTEQTGIQLQAIDNNDGTMSIFIPSASSSGFTGSEFTIIVTIDNGLATNFQQFGVRIISPIASVNNLSTNETLIYPNPVKSILHCNNQENSFVYIYSIYGTIVYSELNSTKNSLIEVSGFKPGTYFIKYVYNNNVVVNKFIHVK